MGTDIVTYQLQQRDHLLRVARAMSARLEPREVLGVVVRSAVGMTGGRAGAIAIREDHAGGLFEVEGELAPRLDRGAGPPLRIVASYQLDERYVDYLAEAESVAEAETSIRQPPRPASGSGTSTGTAEAQGFATAAGPTAAGTMAPASDSTATLGGEPAPAPAGSFGSGASTAGGPLARWSADNGLGHVIGEGEGSRRVLTIPLELRGETIGQIVVLRDVTAAIFSPLDEDLLRAFADQAAVAIQNALLHARVRRSERQLAAVIQDSASGIILLDERGRVIAINPAAATLLGRKGSSGIGASITEVVALEDEAGRPVSIRLPAAAEGTLTPRGRLVDAAAEPTGERWVQISIAPQVGEGSRVEGHVVNIADLTAWREAEQAKSAFLAGLSHELKTPLALIRGFAETLADPEVEREPGFEAQAYKVILDETERLTESVDRLLLASRLQAGALKLRLDVVDVGDLLARLVADLRLAMPSRELVLEVEDGMPAIMADAERLREVFAELIRNAGKYAPPDTPIRVVGAPIREAMDGGGVRVSVVDVGAPIAARERDRIFERFYRGDERGDGTGLGLYMARSIARAHGGDVVVADAGDGSGTNRFDVLLPSSPPSAPR